MRPQSIVLSNELRNAIDSVLSAGINKYYYKFKIPKRGRKGFRNISAPNRELKKIQNDLLILLNECYSSIHRHYITGFAPGTSTKYNANKQVLSQRSLYLDKSINKKDNKFFTIKMDIENAFGSIGIMMIHKYFPKSIEISQEDFDRIVFICTLNGSLPQGAPTSPALLNIILSQFDYNCNTELLKLNKKAFKDSVEKEAKDTLKNATLDAQGKDIVSQYLADNALLHINSYASYTRYADDISISYTRVLKPYWIERVIKKVALDFGLQIKESKTRYMSDRHGRFVTGLNISNVSHICVPRKFRFKVRAMIYEASKEKDCVRKSKLIESIKGKINYIKSIHEPHAQKLHEYARRYGLVQ